MYKDKDKQRQAQKKWVRQKRAEKGSTNEGSTEGTITPEGLAPEVPENYGQADCGCYHCRQVRTNKSKHQLNHGAYKPASELAPNELNRVSLPGDVDYKGVCLQPEYKHRWTQA